MQQWINQTLDSGAFSLTVLAAAFLLGLISSVASACCTLPVFGTIVGYAGTRQDNTRRSTLLAGLFFMLGTIIALIILGIFAGFVGQVAQTTLGRYWKLFAGVVAILLGLAVLNLLPFKFAAGKAPRARPQLGGFFGPAVFGLAVGGTVSVTSMCCNPGIFIVMGVVILKGYSLWAVTILIAYAIAFSLPLTVLVLGVSFGKMAVRAKKVETAIRYVGGAALIAAGFYFLATL